MRGRNPGINEHREINRRRPGCPAPREALCGSGGSDPRSRPGGWAPGSCHRRVRSLPACLVPGQEAARSRAGPEWEPGGWRPSSGPAMRCVTQGRVLNLSELQGLPSLRGGSQPGAAVVLMRGESQPPHSRPSEAGPPSRPWVLPSHPPEGFVTDPRDDDPRGHPWV